MDLERRRIRLVGWIVRRQSLHHLPTKRPRSPALSELFASLAVLPAIPMRFAAALNLFSKTRSGQGLGGWTAPTARYRHRCSEIVLLIQGWRVVLDLGRDNRPELNGALKGRSRRSFESQSR